METTSALDHSDAAVTSSVFAVATNPGLEDILAGELRSTLVGSLELVESDVLGFVCFRYRDSADVRERLCKLRCAHYVMLLHGRVTLAQGETALARLNTDLIPLLPDVSQFESFRVTCSRLGTHRFRSVDVERVVGESIHESQNVPGKMKGAAVVVRVDIVGTKVLLGVQVHAEPLSKRLHPEFVRDASVKPNVAYAMLSLSGMRDGDCLLDPFVGSGTIALEAAVQFRQSNIVGVDKSERVVAGARANAQLLGVSIQLTTANARNLLKVVDRSSVDCIVTNPPWGVRIGKQDDIDDLYRGFLASAWDVLKVGGRLVVLLTRWESFLHHCRSSGRWLVVSARAIRTGDMVPVMFVVEKQDDHLWTSLKKGIHRMIEQAREGDGCPAVVEEICDETAVAKERKRRYSQ